MQYVIGLWLLSDEQAVELIGPFPTQQEAEQWAKSTDHGDLNWELLELNPPTRTP